MPALIVMGVSRFVGLAGMVLGLTLVVGDRLSMAVDGLLVGGNLLAVAVDVTLVLVDLLPMGLRLGRVLADVLMLVFDVAPTGLDVFLMRGDLTVAFLNHPALGIDLHPVLGGHAAVFSFLDLVMAHRLGRVPVARRTIDRNASRQPHNCG